MASEEEPTLEEVEEGLEVEPVKEALEDPVGLEYFEVGLEGDIVEEVPLVLFDLMFMRGAEVGVHQQLQGEGAILPGVGAEVGP